MRCAALNGPQEDFREVLVLAGQEVRNSSQMQRFDLQCQFLAAFLMTVTLAGIALAGPFDDAVAAYGRGDYATAARLLEPLANDGISVAQFNLGLMYDLGQGVTQNDAEAMK